MYDVIIIGAGPSGSSAAKELAANKYRVLLVEKFKMPRNKSCSGILIQKSINLIHTYYDDSIPRNAMCEPINSKGMVLTNDDGQEYRYEQEGLNIWRNSFDYWLAQKAVHAGAELRDGTTVISCQEEHDYVTVTLNNSTEEKARFVIACDGAVSSMKRNILGTPKSFVMTYQSFNKGSIDLDPHYFYAYLQPQFSEYDAWFNVKDDYIIFGVAVRDSKNALRYYQAFIDYMTLKYNAKIKQQERIEKWIMPYIMPGCLVDYGKGRILLAGETAGFLNPMGEGISAGLESGYAAAMAVIEADLRGNFDIKTVHQAYKNNTAELLKYMKRQWQFVATLSNKFKEHWT